jgi:prepilin-type N-terminal cleavage/methylation domain-containing protein
VLGSACRRLRAGEDGMTIIEVMVAMVILLVGVLGTVSLVETGLLSTSRTTAREQGTNLARDLVERSRQVDYTSMTLGLAPATLRATLPASEVSALSGSTFTVTRRGVVYTVTVFACSIDDPTDGAGVGDTTFCAVPTTPRQPGDPHGGAATGPNVLGLSVALGGSLLSTVCNALGSSSALFTSLMAVVNSVVPISICPAGSSVPKVPVDSHADDLRRVRLDVSWTSGGARDVSQTTLLTNPLQN